VVLFVSELAEAPSMTFNAPLAATELSPTGLIVGLPLRTERAGNTSNVVPLRRTVPCASGAIFDIAVEIHLAGSVGRAALALHELHDLAERELTETGDPMMAIVGAADELIEHLADENFDDVSIAIGVALSPVGRAALQVKPHDHLVNGTARAETMVLVHRSQLRLALSTSSLGEGHPIATVSRPTASASLRSARLALNGHNVSGLDSDGADALIIEADGTLHQLVV
jgi:hypothetical protein